MTRVAVALAVVVALAAGVWLLWPDDDQPPSTTLPTAAPTSTVGTTPSTTSPATTGTTSHVVETVEEAEAILRELWFGWFDGIYHQDEDRIREVVIGSDLINDALAEFDRMSFAERPGLEAIELDGTEILKSDTECLAIWSTARATFRTGSSSGVHLLRYLEGRWKLMSYWVYREDLWNEDCSAHLP